MRRSILAVIGGYVVMSIGIMALFMVAFPNPTLAATPSMNFMLFSLAYGFVFAVIGGYVTAWIAKRAEMKHTLALIGLGIVMGIVSVVMAAVKQPKWYQSGNFVVMIAGNLLGGYLRARQVATSPRPS